MVRSGAVRQGKDALILLWCGMVRHGVARSGGVRFGRVR